MDSIFIGLCIISAICIIVALAPDLIKTTDNGKKLKKQLVVIGIVAGFLAYIISPGHQDLGTTVVKAAKTKEDAIEIAQAFIQKRLISPSTAKFASDTETTTEDIGDSTWVVNSYVDSQNSFSAIIRTSFVAKVKYKGSENWQLVDLNTKESNE